MSEDFYPFVDSGDPAPDNTHLTGAAPIQEANRSGASTGATERSQSAYTTRISVYDDMLSTPRVIVVEQADVRTYLEDVTNTVHRTMKEQGGHLSLMIIRELVENFIHAQFSEPVISILDNGDTIRFADQGPGIDDKERAFEFGVTSADRFKKRYIRGTGAGLPMVQQYVEAAGGAISVEDNLGAGTVVTVSVNPVRVEEIERAVSRGAAVRSGHHDEVPMQAGAQPSGFGAVGAQTSPNPNWGTGMQAETDPRAISMGTMAPPYPQGYPWTPGAGVGYPAYGNPYGMTQPYGGIPQGYPMQMGQLGQQSHQAMMGGQMMGMPKSRRHDRRRRDGARVDGTRDSHARRGHARSNANAGHADECHTRRAAALARTKTICERAWGPCSALYRTKRQGRPNRPHAHLRKFRCNVVARARHPLGDGAHI